MTDTHVEQPIEPYQSPPEGPGKALRSTREAKRLTPESVSQQLRLDLAHIHALEMDEYEKLPAPIFVTGYLRAYARLLELDAEPLIAAYHGLGMDKTPDLVQVARRGSVGGGAPVRWISYAMAAGLVVMLYLAWQARAPEVPELVSGPAQDMAPSVSGMESPMVVREPDVAFSDAEPESDRSGPAESPSAPVVTKAEVRAPIPPPAPPATPTTLSRASLSLIADRSSWVEVKDSTGRRLFYDLMNPGQSRTLEGVPPFEVLLGYAPGVTVEYNGQLFDHARYIRNEVARFKVGSADAGGR